MTQDLILLGQQAKQAAFEIARLDATKRQEILLTAADFLLAHQAEILAANEKDMQIFHQTKNDLKFADRLKLDSSRITQMAQGLCQVAKLKDPLGQSQGWINKAGLKITQVRVPLGVIGMIYEARPNVTVDAFGLCFKTGNAVILRGGKEALNTNLCISQLLQEVLKQHQVNPNAVQLLTDPSRQIAKEFMQLQALDVLIPRGSANLIQSVVQNATVPVIETGAGNCHIYIDKYADFKMAQEIVLNAKIQRPSVCNAAEKLLIHQEAVACLPELLTALFDNGVEVRGDETICQFDSRIKLATSQDWKTEYNDYILTLKLVKNLDEAILHINQYSTGHSEAIITNDYQRSQYFLEQIDSACVYVNASTRFTDGFEFGFGAEIGISTQKLHARGPLGLNELTTTKYQILGTGQIRK